MSSRISDRLALAGALLLLAACGAAPPGEGSGDKASPVDKVQNWVTGLGDRRDIIPCAMRDDGSLGAQCRIEIIEDARSRVLILSAPDGGFRRVRVATDGSISAADGADEVRTVSDADHVLIGIKGERYAVPLAALGPGATP